MAQQKGRRYETQLCRDIYRQTDGDLLPIPAGYSGNHDVPSADIIIDDGTKIHAFELKNTSKDRKTVYYDPQDPGKDDIYQLLRFAREYPRTVAPYIGVDFDRRQLVCSKLWLEGPNDRMALQSAVNTTPTDVRLTYDDNLSFHKPSTDIWPSAKSGDNTEYILDLINYTE